jgi:hypothetical protein
VILSGLIKLKTFMKIVFFLRLSLVFYLFTFLVSFPINAQVDIARWDFESLTNSYVTSPAPSIGSGTASIVGSMSTTGAGMIFGFGNCNASSNTAGFGWQIQTANPGLSNESSGVQFMVSTVGYSNIQFYFDNRLSNTSVRTLRIQYTLNGGASWINLDLVEGTGGNYTRGCTNQGGIDNGKIDASNPVGNNSGERWTRATIDFSAITSANENSNFGVRILAAHYSNTGQFRQANNSSNIATAGTWRFDNVAFRGTPIIAPTFNPFQSCNLIVYRVGDGNSALSNAATNVNLLEIGLSGSVVQTINNFTGANLLTQSGSATSNGYFNTYNNLIALPGHNEAVGTVSVNSNNSKRAIIADNTLSYSTYDLPTSAPIPFHSDNFRCIIPTGLNTFYASGSGSTNNGGIWYFNGSTYVQLLAGNVRNIEIYNNQLYFSTSSSSDFGAIGIYKLTNGLPTSGSSQPYTTVATYSTTSGIGGPYGFSLSPDGCTLYVADAGSTGVGSYPGISKWTLSGSSFAYQYSFNTNATGLVVDYSNPHPIIYATTTQTQNNNIIKITDTDVAASTTTILSSGNNYVFRGIDFTPNSNAAITISQQPQSQTVCENEAVSISVSATSSVSLTYQWFSNSIDSYCGASPVSGATSSTFSTSISSAGTTYYFVKIVSLCSSIVFSNRVEVNVNELVNPNFTSISAICPGGNFTLPSTSINGVSGIWTPSINISETTNYVFTPSSGQCANSTSMTVQVYKAPRILALSPP